MHACIHSFIQILNDSVKPKQPDEQIMQGYAIMLRFSSFVLTVAIASAATPVFAGPVNKPAPSGSILDLNGQTINHGAPVQESVSFLAGVTASDITLAFRDDPSYIVIGSVSLVDNTTSSRNLLLNGDFSNGATYWSYDTIYGASFGGLVSTNPDFPSGKAWFDGAIQAYDAIDQIVATTVGDKYTLSFYYTELGSKDVFSSLSTNGDVTDPGGNGVDILACAQSALPPSGGISGVPEPMTLGLFGAGLTALGVARQRRGWA